MIFLEKTIKVIRNGLTHQIPLGLTGRRYFGGGDSDIEFVDPLQGTGLRDLFKKISEFVGPQIGQGVTPFAGTTVADPSALQTQGFQAAGGLSPLATGSFDVFNRALRGEAPGQDILNLGTQGLKDVFQPFDPTSTQERFEANLEPALKLTHPQRSFLALHFMTPKSLKNYPAISKSCQAGLVRELHRIRKKQSRWEKARNWIG